MKKYVVQRLYNIFSVAYRFIGLILLFKHHNNIQYSNYGVQFPYKSTHDMASHSGCILTLHPVFLGYTPDPLQSSPGLLKMN